GLRRNQPVIDAQFELVRTLGPKQIINEVVLNAPVSCCGTELQIRTSDIKRSKIDQRILCRQRTDKQRGCEGNCSSERGQSEHSIRTLRGVVSAKSVGEVGIERPVDSVC